VICYPEPCHAGSSQCLACIHDSTHEICYFRSHRSVPHEVGVEGSSVELGLVREAGCHGAAVQQSALQGGSTVLEKWALVCDLGPGTVGRVCLHTKTCRQDWSGDSRGVLQGVLDPVPCVLAGVVGAPFVSHTYKQKLLLLLPHPSVRWVATQGQTLVANVLQDEKLGTGALAGCVVLDMLPTR
jgi:hypothetical protein